VTHTYNPSYSRGKDQKDPGSRPTLVKVSKTLSPLTILVWWCPPVVPAMQEALAKKIAPKQKFETLPEYLKQVAENLPSKQEALSSNSRTAKNKQKTLQ
jgi:hypothetical protein